MNGARQQQIVSFVETVTHLGGPQTCFGEVQPTSSVVVLGVLQQLVAMGRAARLQWWCDVKAAMPSTLYCQLHRFVAGYLSFSYCVVETINYCVNYKKHQSTAAAAAGGIVATTEPPPVRDGLSQLDADRNARWMSSMTLSTWPGALGIGCCCLVRSMMSVSSSACKVHHHVSASGRPQ
jgi:hypothetical protein